MTKISIVMPVYNSEKTIKRAIDSIVNQNYKDYELLLISDQGNDNSNIICKNYADQYKNIFFFDKEHCGLSNTRNYGISKASGDYILFIDSDDYLENNALEIMINNIEDNDILVFGVCVDFIEEHYKFFEYSNNCNCDNVIEELFNSSLFNYAWNKLYKTSVIKNVKFDSEHIQSEDLFFNIEVFSITSKIKLISDVLYHYIKDNRETLVDKYVPNYDFILNLKDKTIKDFFTKTKTSMQCYYNYMLEEYQIYLLNLFKNHETYRNSKVQIKNVLLTKNVIFNIENSIPKNIFSKIFKLIFMSKSTLVIYYSYSLLTWIKHNFTPLFKLIRKIRYSSIS